MKARFGFAHGNFSPLLSGLRTRDPARDARRFMPRLSGFGSRGLITTAKWSPTSFLDGHVEHHTWRWPNTRPVSPFGHRPVNERDMEDMHWLVEHGAAWQKYFP